MIYTPRQDADEVKISLIQPKLFLSKSDAFEPLIQSEMESFYNSIYDGIVYPVEEEAKLKQSQIMIYSNDCLIDNVPYMKRGIAFDIDEEISEILCADAVVMIGSSGRTIYFNSTSMNFKITFKERIEHVGYKSRLIVSTVSGEVYYWISLEQSRKFHKFTSGDLPFNVKEEKIIDIACGSTMSLILTDQGKIYVTGQNNGQFGQLGVKINSCYTDDWILSSTEHITERIKRVFGAYHTSFLLTEFGHLYSCGASECNGLPNGTDPYKWTLIPNLENEEVIDMRPGLFYSVALTRSGNIYLFGSLNFNQLGKSESYVVGINSVKLFDSFEKELISQLYCAGYNSVILTNAHQIFIAGYVDPTRTTQYVSLNWKSLIPNHDISISSMKIAFTNDHRLAIAVHRNLCEQYFNFRNSWKISDIVFEFYQE